MENMKGVTCSSNETKIIHIHPSLQCNLFCKHCYSESSPQLKNSLPLDKLQTFLQYARGEGYNIVSISGGEPFLYKDLYELTLFTKSIGFYNMAVSNGMLLGSARNKKTLENFDLIAISIDGNKDLHDDMRNFPGAFEKMLAGVSILRELNKTFGFIHTITGQSWKQLLWLAEFAKENGAHLLQLHPLENFGRARESFNYSLPQEILYKSYILFHYIRDKYNGEMHVQLDYLHKEHIKEFPALVNISAVDTDDPGKLGKLINTIIVDEQGDIVPIAYGFSKRYLLGNIYQFDPSENIFEKFLLDKARDLYSDFQEAYDFVMQHEEEMINWNELIVEKASRVMSYEL